MKQELKHPRELVYIKNELLPFMKSSQLTRITFSSSIINHRSPRNTLVH